MVETVKRHSLTSRQLSVKGAMQAVESFTRATMAIDGSEAIYSACSRRFQPFVSGTDRDGWNRASRNAGRRGTAI
jgi:hypothetical protein